MSAARIYLDEDVHAFIADALRLRGWSALTTVEAGQMSSTDQRQIEYATDNGYVILSYNVADFPRLHEEILAAGAHHAGIIVATQSDPKCNATTLMSLVDAFSAEDFVDQLLYLSNWM